MPIQQIRRPHKRLRTPKLIPTVMFALKLVFLALLATLSAQSDILTFTGIPQYVQRQWALTDETLQFEDVNGESLQAEESIWYDLPPEMTEVVTLEAQNLLTTPESYVIKEQDHEGGESAVWKIILVVSVLLVSVVGSLSMAYYLCVWRGGRIHYQAQKETHALI